VTGAGKQKRKLALRMLMDKASVQGYLTTDDLMEFFPDTSGDMERLSVLLTALRHRGVDIVDSDGHETSDSATEPLDLLVARAAIDQDRGQLRLEPLLQGQRCALGQKLACVPGGTKDAHDGRACVHREPPLLGDGRSSPISCRLLRLKNGVP